MCVVVLSPVLGCAGLLPDCWQGVGSIVGAPNLNRTWAQDTPLRALRPRVGFGQEGWKESMKEPCEGFSSVCSGCAKVWREPHLQGCE